MNSKQILITDLSFHFLLLINPHPKIYLPNQSPFPLKKWATAGRRFPRGNCYGSKVREAELYA